MKIKASVLLIAWLVSLYGAGHFSAGCYYTRPAQVVQIEEVTEPHEPDRITFRTIDGYEHTINGWAGGWTLGEKITVLMDKNGTADRSDDLLIDVRSRG